ncbi:unnamed protein product [Calypogeia fissa]
MLITNIGRDIVALAQRAEHEQFLRDMGLYDFVHLPWTTIIGTNEECAQFIRNTTPVTTLVNDELHHNLEVAKTTKKCKAGSHIRIIFLTLERERKQKEAAGEDVPPGFPTP